MLLPQFAHGRTQLPFSNSNAVVTAGGSTTTAHTLYLSIQGENPIGLTEPSTLVPVTVNTGQQLTVTLSASLRNSGEFWDAYVISASLTNDPSTLVQLARIPAYDFSGSEPALIPLPRTVVFSSDEHFKLSQIVANPAALPTNPIPGMRRGVSSLAQIFEYDLNSTLEADEQTVLSATLGRWTRAGSFSTYVADTFSTGGCAQAIWSINEAIVKAPRYGCDGNDGPKRTFWLYNDGTEAVPSGQRVMISISMNEVPRSGLFEGLLKVRFLGYANQSTGELRTTISDGTPFEGLNYEVDFENRKTNLIFVDDLQAGEAYVIEVLPNLIPAYLNYQVIKGTVIKILPGIASQTGAYCEGGDALGDRIYPVHDRGLVVPQPGAAVKVLKRSSLVNSRSSLSQPPVVVSQLTFNTAGQQIRINSNGAVYKGIGTLLDTEAIRAIVDLLPGVSDPCPLSAPISISAADGLRVTLNYPSNGTTATVRQNYPDALLAGNTKAELNPLYVTIYVQVNSIIKKFPNLLLVDGPTQTFDLNDWTAGTTIASIPNAPNSRFCLFEAVSASVTTITGGNFPSAFSVRVSYAFQLDGTTPSAISHEMTDGCIFTSSMTLAEVEAAVQYWAPPVPTYADLPTGVPSGQVRQVSSEDLFYRWNGVTWKVAASPKFWGDPVSDRLMLPLTAPIGQVRLTLNNGKLYRFSTTGWQLASGGGGGGGGGILNSWRLSS